MKGLIVYWSMTGNTESIAQRISDDTGFVLKSVSDTNVSEALEYDVLVLGCPAMGAEELESEEFKPFNDVLISQAMDKKIFLFGSYDWGDGEWMRSWQEAVIENGINKINLNSDLQNVWYQNVCNFIKENPLVYDPRKVISSGKDAICDLIESKINIIK